jgi:hypothetical protein
MKAWNVFTDFFFACMRMKQLTIRNVSQDLTKALLNEKRRRNLSLNQTVLDLLCRTLGLVPGRPYENELAQFAGTWNEDDLTQFEKNTAVFEQIDEDLWR